MIIQKLRELRQEIIRIEGETAVDSLSYEPTDEEYSEMTYLCHVVGNGYMASEGIKRFFGFNIIYNKN